RQIRRLFAGRTTGLFIRVERALRPQAGNGLLEGVPPCSERSAVFGVPVLQDVPLSAGHLRRNNPVDVVQGPYRDNQALLVCAPSIIRAAIWRQNAGVIRLLVMRRRPSCSRTGCAAMRSISVWM